MNEIFILPYPYTDDEQTVRTRVIDGKFFLALEDVVYALAKENKTHQTPNQKHGLMGLAKAQLEALDSDEVARFPAKDGTSREEIFITEPGLYRIVSQDKSPAAKKFQRWVFHEVIPSIRQHGTYPPPRETESSELTSLARLLMQNTTLLFEEIKQREELAKTTKERFDKADAKLKKISEQIENLSENSYEGKYRSIEEHCEDRSIKHLDQQHLWGMCIKICLESNIKSKKIISEAGETKFAFPPHIIDQAIYLLDPSSTTH